MNRWAQMLADLPTTLQRAIARSQRISLPRGCTADERVCRLRRALCRAAAVRVRYATLDTATQAALQQLRTQRRGLSKRDLEAQWGPLRPLNQLARDPRPRSLAERLLLLGWLLPRPAAPFHPPRYLLAPELRVWLPVLFAQADEEQGDKGIGGHGETETGGHTLSTAVPNSETPLGPMSASTVSGLAPLSSCPPIDQAATALLVMAARQPVTTRLDGQLTTATLRHLAARFPKADAAQMVALLTFAWPLLVRCGLVVVFHRQATLSPGAATFLDLPPAERVARLRAAWISQPTIDGWLRPLVPDRRGIDWPYLRRRLLRWGELAASASASAPTALFSQLTAAFGPLADGQTHGFRPVSRMPWQHRRACAIWNAAYQGPLAWFGIVAKETPAQHQHTARAASWHYAASGQVAIDAAAIDRDLLKLAAAADWVASDGQGLRFAITRQSLAQGEAHGVSVAQIHELLQRRAGIYLPTWVTGLDFSPPKVVIAPRLMVSSNVPQTLQQARTSRSVQRYLGSRLAPGLALVEPEQAAQLTAALERQGVVVQYNAEQASQTAVATTLHPGERAALLVACAFYRAHAPAYAPLLPHQDLEQRLFADLPLALRQSVEAALATVAITLPTLPAATPWDPHAPSATASVENSDSGEGYQPPPPPCTLTNAMQRSLTMLRRAISQDKALQMRYTDAKGSTTDRVIRPIELRRRGDIWYMDSYCFHDKAERTFRVDRIDGLWRCVRTADSAVMINGQCGTAP
jgi:hypothetical protein